MCDVLCAGSLQKQGVDERAGSRGSAKEEWWGRAFMGYKPTINFGLRIKNLERAPERERASECKREGEGGREGGRKGGREET